MKKEKPKKFIDFRSDTVTKPTEKMRKAMYEAEVGDDVLEEDPTIKRLEKLAADIVGKEAALFVPSGTFGNQLALFTHCNRGDEVILPENSHIVQHEAGAASIISSVQLRTFMPENNYPVWEEFDLRIRKVEDIHFPHTGLIEIENATSNGDVMPLEVMKEIKDGAKKYNIPIHLDGARLFNAAEYLKVDVKKITEHVDSVMFCLSKGLCAPVGSMLAGTNEFIKKARKLRKIMGGGMRQAGILAAAGIIALNEMRLRLEEDHKNAIELARYFKKTGVFELLSEPKINMFFVRFKEEFKKEKGVKRESDELETKFVELLKENNILTYPPEDGWIRFVTHNDVILEDIEVAGDIIKKIINEL